MPKEIDLSDFGYEEIPAKVQELKDENHDPHLRALGETSYTLASKLLDSANPFPKNKPQIKVETEGVFWKKKIEWIAVSHRTAASAAYKYAMHCEELKETLDKHDKHYEECTKHISESKDKLKSIDSRLDTIKSKIDDIQTSRDEWDSWQNDHLNLTLSDVLEVLRERKSGLYYLLFPIILLIDNKYVYRILGLFLTICIFLISVVVGFMIRDNADLRTEYEKEVLIKRVVRDLGNENVVRYVDYIDFLYADKEAHQSEIIDLWRKTGKKE